MMSTVRNTVFTLMEQNGLTAYNAQAERVIEGLEARDAAITERLTDYAIEQGLPEEQVIELLADVGLRAPVARLVSMNGGGSPVSGEDTPEWASEILNRLESLTQFARDNGYRG